MILFCTLIPALARCVRHLAAQCTLHFKPQHDSLCARTPHTFSDHKALRKRVGALDHGSGAVIRIHCSCVSWSRRAPNILRSRRAPTVLRSRRIPYSLLSRRALRVPLRAGQRAPRLSAQSRRFVSAASRDVQQLSPRQHSQHSNMIDDKHSWDRVP